MIINVERKKGGRGEGREVGWTGWENEGRESGRRGREGERKSFEVARLKTRFKKGKTVEIQRPLQVMEGRYLKNHPSGR